MSPYPCPRRSAIEWSDDWHDARKSCWFSRHRSTASCRDVEDLLTRPLPSKTSGATTASACCFAERDGVAMAGQPGRTRAAANAGLAIGAGCPTCWSPDPGLVRALGMSP